MADARAIIERVRSFGANVLSDQGKIVIVNKEKLPAGAIDYIRQNAREIAEQIDREAVFDERAAIIQYDGGLNRPVAEYLTRLIMSSPPDGADRSDWSWFVGQAAVILDRAQLHKAAA